ncbi:hypothetical protein BPS13_0168 [Bacillus phage BPS13]|uniref:Uncharacterized protein n=2 Tax=Wphvirus TaxID=1922327 RepID=W5QUK1_9CAUD|nr:hypothetical protein BPS13_0168 [Bacillus phage BPS13]YP_009003052.1 hypothetical protein BPS10C_166 [Bacillus phage BPS10C]AEZ50347.1 hypothetical protein BPS13_0168 [Bacillus phage BPS13]AGI12163.1 hypothetical protein BPS10C_166 [Bacillus phage BPS10C]QQO38842.1 hypothetical protein BCPG1_111 [Bacillus phage BCPG1]
MSKKLICYKDVWTTEEGEVHPITAAINHGLGKLKANEGPSAEMVGAGSRALSFMLKLYTDRDAYNKSVNVYQSIPFKYKPSKALIDELLRSTGNKFAHLEYVVKHEETYQWR